MRGGEPGLVRLQVADELPADGGGALRPFLHAFLHAILADGRESVAGGVFGGGRRMGLGHRQQLHSAGIPPRPVAGCGDLLSHGVSPLPKSFVSKEH